MLRKRISLFLLIALLIGLLPVKVQASGRKAGIVITAGSNLNVRFSPTAGSTVLAKLSKGSYVTLVSKAGAWWQVEYAKGRYSYCHGDYIREVSSNTASVTTGGSNLNVRSGGGAGYARIGSLPKGEQVVILSSAGGWSRILYHGTKTGWVSSQYLSAGSAISLAVPSFKQTDSRWANVIIGSSGKTMAQIGCATTAIAMMESYRTGAVTTPAAMAQKLRYTASGSVYWPSHYSVVTNPSGYLSTVYALLKAGKPVLFGARNSYGGQHWVVITGYSGGSTLSPADFTILDPGSGSRTTLQQFLRDYPNFYKFFHY